MSISIGCTDVVCYANLNVSRCELHAGVCVHCEDVSVCAGVCAGVYRCVYAHGECVSVQVCYT